VHDLGLDLDFFCQALGNIQITQICNPQKVVKVLVLGQDIETWAT